MKTKEQVIEFFNEMKTQYEEYNNSSEIEWDEKEKLILEIQIETLEWVLSELTVNT